MSRRVANRHQRRARAARDRRSSRSAGTPAPQWLRRPLARLLLALGGLGLLAVSLLLLAVPHALHASRAVALLGLAGCILIYLAARPR